MPNEHFIIHLILVIVIFRKVYFRNTILWGLSKMYKRRVFYRILWTDIIVILVFISLMIPLCYQMVITISDRELNNSYNSMTNSLNILESQIKSLENILTKAHVNDNLVRISLINGQKQPSDYYAILKAQQYIASIASANSCVADIVVCFESSNVILTKHTSFDNIDAFNRYYNIKDMKNTTFYKDIMSSPDELFEYCPEASISYLAPIGNTRVPLEVFCYVLPLKMSASPKRNGIAYIFIHKDYIMDTAIPQSFKEDGFLQVLDRQGNIILSYGNSPGILDYRDIKHYKESLDGSKYCIVNTSNSDNTLKMIAGIPVRTFIGSVQSVFMLILFYIILLICLGVLASILIAHRQSAPLTQLLQSLENQVSYKEQQYENEYDFINRSIISIKSDKERVLQQLNEFQNTLNSNMIERILYSGQLTSKQYNEILASLENFPIDFVVGYGKVETGVKIDKRDLDVLTMLAIDHLKDLFPSNTIYHSLGENIFAIITPYNSQTNTVDLLGHILSQANLDESMRIVLAISDPHTGIDNVNIAFEQARFIFSLGDKNKELLTSSDITPFSNVTHDIGDYIELYHCIISGDSLATKQYIEQMFKATDIPHTDMEQLYYIIRMTLIFAVRDYTDDEEYVDAIPKYQPHQNPEEMIQVLCDIAYDICNIIDNNKRSHNTKLKESILNYINKNFTDSNIYAGHIAEEFSISEKYLYNFIKEQTGYSLGDYIESLRLEHAANLLISDVEKNITLIANECGYLTYNTFYKAFKRNYGVSPSEYRNRFIYSQNMDTI